MKLIKIKSYLAKHYRRIMHKNVILRKGAKAVNSQLSEFVQLSSKSLAVNSSIGDYSSIGRNSNVYNSTLGKFCSISWNVTIGATQHPANHLSTHAFPYISMYGFTPEDHKIITRTKVGSDVWVGANAIVLPGVEIGDGAIIGAGSVVTKDVAPYTVVAGVPAKKIKDRFPPDLQQAAAALRWWDWPRKKLAKNIHLFKEPLSNQLIKELLE